MAVMLQPPLPIIRDTTEAGTESFLDLRKKWQSLKLNESARRVPGMYDLITEGF